jgi:hypothetical protein
MPNSKTLLFGHEVTYLESRAENKSSNERREFHVPFNCRARVYVGRYGSVGVELKGVRTYNPKRLVETSYFSSQEQENTAQWIH